MPNDDYIKRIDAKKILSLLPFDLDAETVQRCIEAMSRVPAADVEPVIHGKWITLHGRGRSDNQCYVPKYFWCDQCKFTSESRRKYCPNCGAKMTEEENNG